MFKYQVTEPDQFSIFLIKLIFYGGLPVYLAFQPESANPSAHPASELIARGVHTVITLGEKTYVFNGRGEA